MDILRNLFELNDEILLSTLAEKIFVVESDDEEEDIEYVNEKRSKLIKKYNKINNRQFILNNKRYYFDYYSINKL